MLDIRSLLKKWRKGSKKKLTKVIDEVFPYVQDESLKEYSRNMRYLLETDYFSKVLWESVREDTTLSAKHVNSIARLVLFDNSIADAAAALHLQVVMLSDQIKFKHFMIQLLSQCRLELSDALTSALFDLLALLVASSHRPPVRDFIDKLVGVRVWTNLGNVSMLLLQMPQQVRDEYEATKSQDDGWLFAVLVAHQMGAAELSKLAIERFLTECLLQPPLRLVLCTFLKELGFVCGTDLRRALYFPIDASHQPIPPTAIEIARCEAFYRIQRQVARTDPQLWLLLLPSVYDTNEAEVAKYLETTDTNQLAEAIGVAQHVPPVLLELHRVIHCITAKVFPPAYTLELVVLDELAALDDYSQLRLSSLPGGPFLTMQDFLLRTATHWCRSYANLAHSHVLSVLERLAITPAGEARGTSKYASGIESESGASAIKASKQGFVSVGNRVLLIEVIKPNPYAVDELLVKYGVAAMQSAIVTKIDGDAIVLSDAAAARFNYALLLPPDIHRLDLVADRLESLQLPTLFKSAFLAAPLPPPPPQLASCKVLLPSNGLQLLQQEFEQVEVDAGPKRGAATVVSGTVTLRLHGQRCVVECQSEGAASSPPCFGGIISALTQPLTVLRTRPHASGDLLQSLLSHLWLNNAHERVLVMVPSGYSADGAQQDHVFLTGDVEGDRTTLDAKVELLLQLNSTLLARVDQLAAHLGLTSNYGQSYEDAMLLYETHIEPRWLKFLLQVQQKRSLQTLTQYPLGHVELADSLFDEQWLQILAELEAVAAVFDHLERLRPLVKLERNRAEQRRYVVNYYCRCIVATHASLNNSDGLVQRGVAIDTLIWAENQCSTLYESVEVLGFLQPSCVLRMVCIGDPNFYKDSLVNRLLANGLHGYGPDDGVARSIYDGAAKSRDDVTHVHPGFDRALQFVATDAAVEEAEYLVATFQYMCLLGYPSSSIGIVACSPIQHHLVREVLAHKCALQQGKGPKFAFGNPKFVHLESLSVPPSGLTCQYLLASLHASDDPYNNFVRAAVMATDGLYVFCAPQDIPRQFDKPTSLIIRTGETYGINQRGKQATIEDAAHMADYVLQMMKKATPSSPRARV